MCALAQFERVQLTRTRATKRWPSATWPWRPARRWDLHTDLRHHWHVRVSLHDAPHHGGDDRREV